MIKSWIMNSVSKEISGSLLYIRTAAEVWKELKDRYSQSNRPRIYELKKSLSALSQESIDVTGYYTRLKTLCDELCEYQPDLDPQNHRMRSWFDYLQEECVLQFLIGLNDSFAPLRAQILTMDPFLSISKVFALAIQEERQRTLSPN